MRVVVIGASGAGKTLMAEQIASHFAIPLIALDWRTLSTADPAQVRAEVAAATNGPAWVIAGHHTTARSVVWARATHLVWLDYSRHVVLRRMLRRAFRKAWRRERLHAWRAPGHPIRWAWRMWQSNRTTTAARLADPHSAHLKVIQVIRPKDAGLVIERLLVRDQTVR